MTNDLDPDTIRACIAALPMGEVIGRRYGSPGNVTLSRSECVSALEALLPDPTQMLMDEWEVDVGPDWLNTGVYNFAHWLLENYEVTRK